MVCKLTFPLFDIIFDICNEEIKFINLLKTKRISMKSKSPFLKFICFFLFLLAFTMNGNAQLLKKLGKRAEKAAERAIERRVEKETTEKTEEVLDSILEPGSKSESPSDKKGNPIPDTENPNGSPGNSDEEIASENGNTSDSSSEPKSLAIYSKFDYVPGDKLLFFDDFKNDFIGDFPSKWNTNGSGEVVTIGESSDRWLQILPGHNTYYVPDVPKLPENYTIEFDILAIGVDGQTSSAADLRIFLTDDGLFKRGKNHVRADIPFCQYTPVGIRMKNFVNNMNGAINNVVDADIRNAIMNRPHISIAVNQKRMRLWVNEKKYIDIPRIIDTPGLLSHLKFALGSSFKDGKEKIFITNLKVAEGGVDLRRKLISEGKISTNGILFDSGSANIQPQSMGIIRQISQVLQQDPSINLKIVGHTDSDGSDEANMVLSKKRAEAVIKILTSIYGASPERLSAEGMGESQPVSDNNSVDGKAQNRRVEFIKR